MGSKTLKKTQETIMTDTIIDKWKTKGYSINKKKKEIRTEKRRFLRELQKKMPKEHPRFHEFCTPKWKPPASSSKEYSLIQKDEQVRIWKFIPFCSVCLENFNLKEYKKKRNLFQQLSCGHEFHVECIDSQSIANNTCPNCRQDEEKQEPMMVDKTIDGWKIKLHNLVKTDNETQREERKYFKDLQKILSKTHPRFHEFCDEGLIPKSKQKNWKYNPNSKSLSPQIEEKTRRGFETKSKVVHESTTENSSPILKNRTRNTRTMEPSFKDGQEFRHKLKNFENDGHHLQYGSFDKKKTKSL